MINYGYFRHRFDAHLNPKLNSFVDDVGIIGFAYYYTLLEIYGAHYAKNSKQEFVKITARELANTWRKRVDSVDLVITKLQLSGLLVYTKCDSTYSIDIPNYSKYYGSYKKTTPSTPSNKIKGKEIKGNIILPAASKSVTPDAIVDVWNREFAASGQTVPGLGGGKHLENCIEAIKHLDTLDKWRNLFAQATSSEFLSKGTDSWKVNLLWLVDYDNALKVLSGNYSNTNQADSIIQDFLKKVQK
jgi:hypothetical protein